MFDSKTKLSTAPIIFGLVISILLLLSSRVGVFSSANPHINNMFGGWQSSNLNFFQGLRRDFEFFFDIAKVKKENDELYLQNLLLTDNIVKTQIRLGELELLYKQQSFNLPYKLVPVLVTSYSKSQTEIVISKGNESGIKINDVVIFYDNLVGIISEVNSGFSKARLITSSESKISIQTLATNVKGFAVGTNTAVIELKEVPNNVTVREGDVVVTAGIDGLVPHGLVLGQIVNVDSDPAQITQSVTAKSKIRFNDLQYLFVIIK